MFYNNQLKTVDEYKMLDLKRIYLSDIFNWMLIPFIIGLITISHIPNFSKIMVLYGLVYSLLFLLYSFYLKLKIPYEIFIYFLWIVWSLSGFYTAINTVFYITMLITVIQMGALLFVIAQITALHGNISLVMLSISIGGIIIALLSLYSGEFRIAGEIESTTRVGGLTGNANSFAYHLLFVIIAMFHFWERKISFWRQILIISVITISVLGIIFSGSRKGFLSILVFLSLWFFYCQGKNFFKRPINIIAVLLFISGFIYFVTDYIFSNTYLGERFNNLQDSGNKLRIQMYIDGFKMIKDNPVFGVGLDNFRVWGSTGMYSHSDYIEVAANTGIVGFILYFSIYLILWLRLNRIRSLTTNISLLNTIGILKASIVTILLTAFGRPNVTSKLTWIFLGAAIGYSWLKNREISLSLEENNR